MESEYLQVIEAERDSVDQGSFIHAYRLLTKEHDLVERGNKYLELHTNKKCRITAKVLIPVNDFPEVNLVGKLLGPGGGTLKEIAQATGCKLSILGKGSMRDKEKEEESRRSNDPKFHHLYDELHIQVEVLAPPLEGYARLQAALSDLKPLLIPGEEDYAGARDSFRGRGGGRGRSMMGSRGGGFGGGATNGRGGRMPSAGGFPDPYEQQGYNAPYQGGGGYDRDEYSNYDYNQEGGFGQNNFGSYDSAGYGEDYSRAAPPRSFGGKAPRGRGEARGRSPYPSPRGGSRGSARGSPRGRGGRGN